MKLWGGNKNAFEDFFILDKDDHQKKIHFYTDDGDAILETDFVSGLVLRIDGALQIDATAIGSLPDINTPLNVNDDLTLSGGDLFIFGREIHATSATISGNPEFSDGMTSQGDLDMNGNGIQSISECSIDELHLNNSTTSAPSNPVTPVGYVIVYIDGTGYKMPYFS
jgi:hypothetical protein